jgi:hypothetical protein
VSDSFPGTRRVILDTTTAQSSWEVRMFLTDLRARLELLVSCTSRPAHST